jgi:hypothetical protein
VGNLLEKWGDYPKFGNDPQASLDPVL